MPKRKKSLILKHTRTSTYLLLIIMFESTIIVISKPYALCTMCTKFTYHLDSMPIPFTDNHTLTHFAHLVITLAQFM